MTLRFIAIIHIFGCLSFSSHSLFSQQNYNFKNSQGQYFRLKVENDMLILRGKTDRYFSSGLKLNYGSDKKIGASNLLGKIFPKVKGGEDNYGYSLASNMFTPSNNAEVIVQGDRPYCGWAYLGFTNISNDNKKGIRFSTEYSVGAIGPITQQELMQKKVHEFIQRPEPKGWKNQIANDIAINLNFVGEKYIIKPIDNVELIGIVETNVGTVTNYMGFGGMLRVGWFENYFNRIMPISSKKNWQAFIFARPVARIIADNSLLQGGILNYSKSPYVISRDDVNHLYMETEFGYSLSYRSINLTYSQNFRTAEFKDAKNMFWGAVAMTAGF
jgi:lipid A 3-O-deacylase